MAKKTSRVMTVSLRCLGICRKRNFSNRRIMGMTVVLVLGLFLVLANHDLTTLPSPPGRAGSIAPKPTEKTLREKQTLVVRVVKPPKPTEKKKPSENQTLPWCPDPPTIKDDSVVLNLNETTYKQLVAELGDTMQAGGHYAPTTCRSREHLALIIPYRDRERNLYILLRNLLPFLCRQMVEFTVFLAEQTAELPFNKGVLFNAAFVESQRMANITCFIMQDTDLIPMDNRNLYRCADQPRHLVLTHGQTEWRSKLPYPTAFGGAIALRKKHIVAANGFSVSYYGWGLEDDDLNARLRRSRFTITRYPILIGKYYALDHEKALPNPRWEKLRKSIMPRFKTEGLNTLNYTLVRRDKRELFTWLLVKVPPPPFALYGNTSSQHNPVKLT